MYGDSVAMASDVFKVRAKIVNSFDKDAGGTNATARDRVHVGLSVQ